MNLSLDSQQTEELRNCYETMRHSFPTCQFVFAPVLIPAGGGAGEPWITSVYEVHWPFYNEDGIPGFMWVTADGELVTTDFNPAVEDYFP